MVASPLCRLASRQMQLDFFHDEYLEFIGEKVRG